jgi:hypothetical protein
MEAQADNASVPGVDAKTDKGKEIEGGGNQRMPLQIFLNLQ